MIRKLFFYLVAVIVLGACSSSNENEISLNGIWNFKASNGINETEVLNADYAQWDTLNVPGNWDTRERYSEYVGKAYYQREITIPKNWEGKQIRLKFDAVYQRAKVWLDGELLGEHLGGYTPFEFNISGKVSSGNSYSLVVMADNTHKRGAWWAWGGISRKVSLIADNAVRMVYQHIDAIPDFKRNKIKFNIRYKVENNVSGNSDVVITSVIKKDGETLITKKRSYKRNDEAGYQYQLSFEEELSDFLLWDVDNPHLYVLESSILVDGELSDVKQDNFGIRKFEVRGEQFFLNNKPVRLNGINRVHDHPDVGNTEPDWLVKQDVQDIKSLGCDFARLMHAPLATNLLDVCDSLGFMVVEEIPVWGNDDPNSFPDNPLTKQWLREMIHRDYNHPSVVGWSVGNELRDSVPPWGKKLLTPGQLGYVNSMLDYIDELDTTRLKTYVTLSADSEGANKCNEPYDKIDFIAINSYGNAIRSAKAIHENFAGKPVFFSEIGIGQIGPAPDAKLKDDLVNYMRQLKDFPFVAGISLWCYNDYRSNYKGTPESGFREWGIVDERRNRKAAYYQLKDIYEYWESNE